MASLSIRTRLMWAVALMLGLLAAVPLGGGVSAATVARGILGVSVVGALGWWWRRRAMAGPGVVPPSRMTVVSRAGLSQRCGLALVEVDGRGYLVVHGDSFAEIRETKKPRPFARSLPLLWRSRYRRGFPKVVA
ncbi:hypothetical protein JGU66_00595 [Myxococcaceae bacterium JPH2]|nr:hypothetical protein [Myxococcaceae bacterium JPH2]